MIISGTPQRPRKLEDLIDTRLLARLDRLDVRSRKLFPGKLQGERRSKRRGQSVEFDDYRNYVPGDDLRHIDWNAYARFDRLFIKLFLEEEDLALHVALDASASMEAGATTPLPGGGAAQPSKLVFASRLAMALCYIGLVNQNRVGLTVFGAPGMDAIRRLPDTRGRHQVQRLGQFLIDSVWGAREGGAATGGQPAPQADFNSALTTIARMRVGKGVMIVLSDFFIPDGYQPGLKALAAAGGYDTYCVQILAPTEIEPERAGEGALAGDLRLTDIETGRAAEVTVTAPLIKQYKQRLDRYCDDLHAFCAARAMSHIPARADADIETLLLETFRRRGVLA